MHPSYYVRFAVGRDILFTVILSEVEMNSKSAAIALTCTVASNLYFMKLAPVDR